MWDVPLFPEQASTTAARVDALYFGLLGLTFFFTALIYGLLVYFAIKYRKGSRADRSNPVSTNHKIELLWIAIPLVISIVFFVWASRVYFELFNPPSDAAEVFVVGKQWMWYLQHPEGKRETNELHVPLGRPIRLTMTSQDVIHSFYVPAFRMKQDVLLGRYTTAWFQPTRTGRFHLYCAEYCGTNHAVMGGFVVVMEPADYERWLTQGSTGESMVSAGAKLFQQYHCNGCHGANPTVRAPRLEGLYGGPVPIREGGPTRMVIADDRYIRDSILLPQSQIVAGYEPVMPPYEGQISEPDLLQIIAYIKSLGRNGGDTP